MALASIFLFLGPNWFTEVKALRTPIEQFETTVTGRRNTQLNSRLIAARFVAKGE